MTDKVQKIREEVERLKNRAEYNFGISLTENERQFWLGESNVLTLIGKHIDTLQEEPVSENLEEAIDKYLDNGMALRLDWKQCDITFKASRLIKFANYIAQWQKQQMMAKAVDGVVHRFDGCGVASVHYNDPNGVPMAYFILSEGLSAGDKVKIITIKKK